MFLLRTEYLRLIHVHVDLENTSIKFRQTENLTPQKEINNL